MLGKTIARLRKRKGLTQAEFSQLVGVHIAHVPKWESGAVQPRAKALEKIAEVLDVSVEELLAGDYSGLTTTLNGVDDPTLVDLFSQIHILNERERDALKMFLEAMLTRARIEQMTRRN
jgi:transcriptional regulator with XRE-family HTH domain